MTCRHSKDDPACSSHPDHYRYHRDPEPKTPDSRRFKWIAAEQVGSYLVGKVQYPNCNTCAFEGTKIMVWANVTPITALTWQEIDPHFHTKKSLSSSAPSPVARFPGTREGWDAAIQYCRWLSGK